MEENSFNLNETKILNKVFSANVKGYDPDEVDSFLDEIIVDYQSFDRYYADSKKYIVDLETQLRKARDTGSQLEIENAKLSNRLSGIKDGDNVNSGNIELLQRINRLEKELFRLGVDPRKI